MEKDTLMTIDEAIEFVRWYFEKDGGVAADKKVREAISLIIENVEKDH